MNHLAISEDGRNPRGDELKRGYFKPIMNNKTKKAEKYYVGNSIRLTLKETGKTIEDTIHGLSKSLNDLTEPTLFIGKSEYHPSQFQEKLHLVIGDVIYLEVYRNDRN